MATSAATPAVVPAARTTQAAVGTGLSMSWYPLPSAPNPKYAAMTTRLDSTGASAGAANLRCDWRIPYSTTARP